MRDIFHTDVFGVERKPGIVDGIIAAVYQNVFGEEVYPTLEEKAANLLYFMIKDHPYVDGCKRIAASLFLEFLDRNHALYTIIPRFLGLTTRTCRWSLRDEIPALVRAFSEASRPCCTFQV